MRTGGEQTQAPEMVAPVEQDEETRQAGRQTRAPRYLETRRSQPPCACWSSAPAARHSESPCEGSAGMPTGRLPQVRSCSSPPRRSLSPGLGLERRSRAGRPRWRTPRTHLLPLSSRPPRLQRGEERHYPLQQAWPGKDSPSQPVLDTTQQGSPAALGGAG